MPTPAEESRTHIPARHWAEEASHTGVRLVCRCSPLRTYTTSTALPGETRELAFAQEVVPGEAEIWATTEGETPRAYKVRIEKVNDADPRRNMILRVTDPALLARTGGIVQGMSGSPILQNGRLVGAVTHVLVNDPTRGYGIFAQTMLEQAQQAAKTDHAA